MQCSIRRKCLRHSRSCPVSRLLSLSRAFVELVHEEAGISLEDFANDLMALASLGLFGASIVVALHVIA